MSKSIIEPPGLWLPKHRVIEARDPIVMRIRMEGSFRLRTHNGRGRTFNESAEIPNLITDAILDAFGTGKQQITDIRVGTGNNAPSASDTALQTQVAASSSTQATSGGSNVGADRYCWASITRRFSPPGSNLNLQEVGAWAGDTMWSRALVVDGSGNPVSFPWGSDEILDVTYTFRLYPPLVDWEETVNIAGVARDVVLRPANVDGWNVRADNSTGTPGGGPAFAGFVAAGSDGAGNAYSGALGAITDFPSTPISGAHSRTLGPYTNGSFTRGATLTFGTGQGNGNIRCVTFSTYQSNFNVGQHPWQFSMDPVLTKTNAQSLQLYVQTSWGRHTP